MTIKPKKPTHVKTDVYIKKLHFSDINVANTVSITKLIDPDVR